MVPSVAELGKREEIYGVKYNIAEYGLYLNITTCIQDDVPVFYYDRCIHGLAQDCGHSIGLTIKQSVDCQSTHLVQ